MDRETARSPERLFERFLLPRVPRAKAPLLLVDVGANRGQFAISVVAAGHRSIAFEPSPATCAELKRAVADEKRAVSELGREASRACVDVHCVVVGAEAGFVRFASSASNASTSAHVSDTDGVSVPVVRLDDILASEERGFYLKTDTEGFEGEVLRGADQLLRSAAPRVLLVELAPATLEQHGSSVQTLIAQITSYGYDCTFGNFFSAYAATGPGSKVAFTSVPIPRVLEGKAEVSVDEITALLARWPGTHMTAWTDLLCWAPTLDV